MPALEAEGTQTATINTEHVLSAPTTAKTRTLTVDLFNLATGEVVELRVKLKARASGTERTLWTAVYVGPVPDPNVQAPAAVMLTGGSFTLKQTSGTGRNFDWSVATLD